uniref:Apyrase-like n=1 Tax=Nicotiana sylvestris TaxID=4096 RepID=A0A1U7X7H2_NICSY|nr:PREDICTED: apyrase-like [Nicotiana sylvestris]
MGPFSRPFVLKFSSVPRETNPGLSSYADDPKAAANSLKPLLKGAEGAVPKELQSETPLELGVSNNRTEDVKRRRNRKDFTSGYYSYGGVNYKVKAPPSGTSLKKCRRLTRKALKIRAPCNYKNCTFNGVWNGGGGAGTKTLHVSSTFYGVGAQVEMSNPLYKREYEISRKQPQKEANTSGTLNKALKSRYYSYGGVNYKVKAPPSGTSLKKCRRLTRKALKIRAPCNYKNCTFNGVWNGGGGAGTKTLHVSSTFYGVGAQVGIVDSKFPSAIAKPIQYLNAGKVACKTKAADIKSIFPNTQDRNIPYLCIDLVYDYTLLVDGFGLNPYKDIIVMRDVKYKNYLVRAAWPLGCAIDLVSSSSKKTRISSY